MDLGLAGRRALVLGGNRGMGLAIAHALAREGAHVAIAARDTARLLLAAAELRAHGTEIATLEMNLADTPGLAALPSRLAVEGFDAVDILVNNTGGPPYGGVLARDPAHWADSFRDMALSVVAVTDALLPAMRARRWGRVVTVVSSGAVQPIPVLGISNTLRAGLIAWSKSLANEVAADGITANILMPGRIATERVRLTDEAVAAREAIPVAEVERRSVATIPLNRYGAPEEVADTVAFLCSARAGYTTGTVVRVDGGIVRHV